MPFNYNPLWKLLIDKGMTKTQLAESLGIARTTITRMGKNELVSMEVLDKICQYFNCQLSDIVEHIKK